MTYWDKATQEQRLIQIDAGISLGMTSKQIAMCLGAPRYDVKNNAVRNFGQKHGRHFTTPPATSGQRGGKIGGRIGSAVQRRRSGYSDVTHKDAFSIFGNTDELNPFNALLPEPAE